MASLSSWCPPKAILQFTQRERETDRERERETERERERDRERDREREEQRGGKKQSFSFLHREREREREREGGREGGSDGLHPSSKSSLCGPPDRRVSGGRGTAPGLRSGGLAVKCDRPGVEGVELCFFFATELNRGGTR